MQGRPNFAEDFYAPPKKRLEIERLEAGLLETAILLTMRHVAACAGET
jgi:hypothetical protein